MNDNNLKLKNVPESLIPYLNGLISNIDNFYINLARRGYYLPKRRTKAISAEYLWGIFVGEIYCPKIQDMKIGFLPRYIPKVDLLDILKVILPEGKVHGLDDAHLPNDDWIVNIIHTLKPKHEIFQFIKLNNEEEE